MRIGKQVRQLPLVDARDTKYRDFLLVAAYSGDECVLCGINCETVYCFWLYMSG